MRLKFKPINFFWAFLLVALLLHFKVGFPERDKLPLDLANQAGYEAALSYVMDRADLLSRSEELSLIKTLKDREKEGGEQIVVLTVEDLEGQSIDEFALERANDWGIGQAGFDNGILILLAENERQVRIELGLGVSRIISDEAAKAIIDFYMTPQFRDGDFSGGLEMGIKELISILDAAQSSFSGSDHQFEELV